MDSEIRRLTKENQRLTDTIDMKNHEIEELFSSMRSMETANNDLSSKYNNLSQN